MLRTCAMAKIESKFHQKARSLMATILDLHDELLAQVFALSVHLDRYTSHITPKWRVYRRLAALASLCKQAALAVYSTACCMQLLSAKFMHENSELTPKQLLVQYFRPTTVWFQFMYDPVTIKSVQMYVENHATALRHELASKCGLPPHSLVLYVNGIPVEPDAVVPQPRAIRATNMRRVGHAIMHDMTIDMHEHLSNNVAE